MNEAMVKDLANDVIDELGDIGTLLRGQSVSVEEITTIVKGVIGELVKPVAPIVPDINVDLVPTFEVTSPAPDMQPIAEALVAVLSRPEQPINIQLPEKAGVLDIEVVERDTFGNIKRLRMTEVG